MTPMAWRHNGIRIRHQKPDLNAEDHDYIMYIIAVPAMTTN